MQKSIGADAWRGRYTQDQILDYCESDVLALEAAARSHGARIDLPRALLRGRYMAAAAAIEHAGTPIDVATLARLRDGWAGIQGHLIAEIDRSYGVFEGRTFKRDRFADWLARAGIPWPRLPSGQLDLSDGEFRQQARAFPQVSALRELRSASPNCGSMTSRSVMMVATNSAVRLPGTHGAQSAQQLEIHLRSERLVARTDQAAARPRRLLPRLSTTRIRNRCRLVGRPEHAGSL